MPKPHRPSPTDIPFRSLPGRVHQTSPDAMAWFPESHLKAVTRFLMGKAFDQDPTADFLLPKEVHWEVFDNDQMGINGNEILLCGPQTCIHPLPGET